MKRLPIGIQTFSKIRNEGFLYVDKTEAIHRLLNQSGYFFLARPRRFGKSLLLSTLKEIFQGNKSLFEGLWIADKHLWEETSPVVHLGFSSMDYRTFGLELAIIQELEKVAADYQLVLERSSAKRMFLELLQLLHASFGQVAILMDEYDKPLIDYLGVDIEQAKANQTILKSFYSVVKDADPFIRFFFVTGVSKFSKVSIFSDLNNLHDLTFDSDFSNLLGYTQQELEHYFEPFYPKALEKNGLQENTLLQKVKDWYNGYSWDGKTFLYNPFSTLSFFQTGDFRNYWFETGTPTFLLELMKSENIYQFDRIQVNESSFSGYQLDQIRLLPLLFQTGYLTIKEKGEVRYTLDYPNREVRESMHQYMLGQLMNQDPAFTTNSVLDIYAALTDNDLPLLIDHLKGLFARIPYQIFIANQEAYYHSLLYIAFHFLGIYTQTEVQTNRGRLDVVVFTPTDIYLMEFKLDESAEAALSQIRDKKYYERFLNQGKTVRLLGIGFSSKEKSIAEWKMEEIKA